MKTSYFCFWIKINNLFRLSKTAKLKQMSGLHNFHLQFFWKHLYTNSPAYILMVIFPPSHFWTFSVLDFSTPDITGMYWWLRSSWLKSHGLKCSVIPSDGSEYYDTPDNSLKMIKNPAECIKQIVNDNAFTTMHVILEGQRTAKKQCALINQDKFITSIIHPKVKAPKCKAKN